MPKLQLRISDVFWLTTIVAIAIAWWTDHCGLKQQDKHLYSRIENDELTLQFAQNWLRDAENFDRERFASWLRAQKNE
jgi:hypothetical protein